MKKLFQLWTFFSALAAVAPAVDAQQDEDMERNKRVFEEVVQEAIKSNVPIQFYGRVVDQNGSGVAGVKVKVEVMSFNEALTFKQATTAVDVDRKKTALELTTDQRGMFVVQKVKGQLLQIAALEKEGYKPNPNVGVEHSFQYSKAPEMELHKPDPQNPVVFYLWKSVEAEPLLQVGEADWNEKGRSYRMTVGKVYTIDLIKRQGKEGANTEGDLRVQLNRPVPVNNYDVQLKRTINRRYDWSFVIEAVDGGIIETDDRFLYLAPETGYEPRYELMMRIADPNWRDRVEKKIYLSSRKNKVFAAIQMTIISGEEDHGGIRLNYLANPSGSRNLEFDPGKLIDPGRIEKVGLEKAIEEVKAKASSKP